MCVACEFAAPQNSALTLDARKHARVRAYVMPNLNAVGQNIFHMCVCVHALRFTSSARWTTQRQRRRRRRRRHWPLAALYMLTQHIRHRCSTARRVGVLTGTLERLIECTFAPFVRNSRARACAHSKTDCSSEGGKNGRQPHHAQHMRCTCHVRRRCRVRFLSGAPWSAIIMCEICPLIIIINTRIPVRVGGCSGETIVAMRLSERAFVLIKH